MSPHGASRRGGILRAVLALLALGALAALGVWLIYTRGARMQEGLHDAGGRIRDKVTSQVDPEPAGPAEGPEGGGAAGPKPAPAGPGSRPPRPKSPYSVDKPPPVARTTHRVAREDTLFRIAETYYEDGTLWPIIAEANRIGPSGLKEGMVLVIPGR